MSPYLNLTVVAFSFGLLGASCGWHGTPEPPVVDAGEDLTVYAGSTVTLSGSASGCSDGYLYSWVRLEGDPQSYTPVGETTDKDFRITFSDDAVGTFVFVFYAACYGYPTSSGFMEDSVTVNVEKRPVVE
jgi:hypothetical protein